jgi:hypothetical protein
MRDHSALPSDALVLTAQAVIPATPTSRIVRLELGGAPFAFEAGQAALIGPATHEARIPYSIASAPIETLENGWLDFLIKVEPSGDTSSIRSRLACGWAFRGRSARSHFHSGPRSAIFSSSLAVLESRRSGQ